MTRIITVQYVTGRSITIPLNKHETVESHYDKIDQELGWEVGRELMSLFDVEMKGVDMKATTQQQLWRMGGNAGEFPTNISYGHSVLMNVSVDPSDTIRAMKEKIQSLKGFLPEQQKISYSKFVDDEVTFKVSPANKDTVLDIKKKIQKARGIPTSQQVLSCKGKQLDDRLFWRILNVDEVNLVVKEDSQSRAESSDSSAAGTKKTPKSKEAASVEETMKAINKTLKRSYPDYSCQTVSWEDASRGTVEDKLSSLGPNISDVRMVAKDGKQLYTVRSDNWNEKLGKVSSNDVCLVVDDPESGDLTPVTLTDYLKNVTKYGKQYGLDPKTNLHDPDLDKEVSIRFQTTFLPIPDEKDGKMEFCLENYNYQTLFDSCPKNMMVLGTTQGASLQQDGPGAERLYHHAFNEQGIHRYWFECERTKHKVGGEQKETKEEQAAAAKKEKAAASVIGVKAMGTRFNALVSVQIPVKQEEVKELRGKLFGTPFVYVFIAHRD